MERAIPGDPRWPELSVPHLTRYLAAAEYARGRRVLDAAAGAGYGACLLKNASAVDVQAVDIDAPTVGRAREQFGGENITFLVDDCERLQGVTGPFDVICCFEALEHLERPERFLQRACQLLTSDGVLLVSTPDKTVTPPPVDGRPRNPFHIHEWNREEFEDLLSAHFSSVEIRAQVQSASLGSRMEAVRALRSGLLWSNPLLVFLWRKLPFISKRQSGWKKLAALATPVMGDYPIVPLAVAPAYGKTFFHFAICRLPKTGAVA